MGVGGIFLSTLSLRRATGAGCTSQQAAIYFYPRSPCGERQNGYEQYYIRARISIHALLAESDGVHYDNYNLHCVISIHALLAESDSTFDVLAVSALPDFYPRSPCGERLEKFEGVIAIKISIHALLAESDPIMAYNIIKGKGFLSTLSLRRATSVRPETRQHDVISIHALLAESDSQQPAGTTSTTYFYPRSPCGERPTNHG